MKTKLSATIRTADDGTATISSKGNAYAQIRGVCLPDRSKAVAFTVYGEAAVAMAAIGALAKSKKVSPILEVEHDIMGVEKDVTPASVNRETGETTPEHLTTFAGLHQYPLIGVKNVTLVGKEPWADASIKADLTLLD